MKIIIAVLKFIYKYSGIQMVVSEIESFVFRYKLRVRMVPVSYKLFVFSLGLLIGGSGVFVHSSYSELFNESRVIIENTRVLPVEAKEIEAPEVEKEKSIEEKIAETFPENPALMIAVAKAESGLDKMATNRNKNGSRDIGLMMINSVHGYDDIEMFDVDKNLKAAREIYDKQGITAWAAFNNGSYKQFLK